MFQIKDWNLGGKYHENFYQTYWILCENLKIEIFRTYVCEANFSHKVCTASGPQKILPKISNRMKPHSRKIG